MISLHSNILTSFIETPPKFHYEISYGIMLSNFTSLYFLPVEKPETLQHIFIPQRKFSWNSQMGPVGNP